MRIFLTHPDRQLAKDLARRLHECTGSEIKTFDDGLELYIAMGRTVADQAQWPSAIVIDAAAPRIGGLLLARLLKYNAVADQVPIVVTTTASTAATMRRDAELAHVDALIEIDPATDTNLAVDLVAARVAAVKNATAA